MIVKAHACIAVAAVILIAMAGAGETRASTIEFGQGHSLATSGRIPEVGEPLRLVGQIAAFDSPVDPTGHVSKNAEFTYVFEGFLCTTSGVWDGDPSNASNWYAQYTSGGVLKIYGDESPDMDVLNPASFTDGVLLLEARFSTLVLGGSPSQYGSLQFTGGALFDQVSARGVGRNGSYTGTFSFFPPPPVEDLGYGGVATGASLWLLAPTPVEERSWGSVKALYDRP